MEAFGTASNPSNESGGPPPPALVVRRFNDSDRDDVLEMYPRGLAHAGSGEAPSFIAELLDRGDSGRARIWIAEFAGQVVACLVVAHEGPEVAHLRGLSVSPEVEDRTAVIRRLVDTAVMAAWDDGYLKLVVHTSRTGAELEPYFHRVSFEFSRETWVDGRHVVEFYQNIYRRPESQHDGAGDGKKGAKLPAVAPRLPDGRGA